MLKIDLLLWMKHMFGLFVKKKPKPQISPLKQKDPRYMLLPPSPNQLAVKNQKWSNNQNAVLQKFKSGLSKGSIKELEDALSCFQAYNLFITEDQLQAAKQLQRPIVYNFLCYKQKESLSQLTYLLNPRNVIEVLLNYQTIPIEALSILIATKSNFLSAFNEEENQQDGNTLLHRLILENEFSKLSICLQAILRARCYQSSNEFNVKKTNHANKTVWHLALESENTEMIKLVFLYLQPKCSKSEREQAISILGEVEFSILVQQQGKLTEQAQEWVLAQIAKEDLELSLECLDFADNVSEVDVEESRALCTVDL